MFLWPFSSLSSEKSASFFFEIPMSPPRLISPAHSKVSNCHSFNAEINSVVTGTVTGSNRKLL